MLRKSLCIRFLGCRIKIKSEDVPTLQVIRRIYGAMEHDGSGAVSLEYSIHKKGAQSAFCIDRAGSKGILAPNLAALLYRLEKDLTIEVQKLRRDLYFIHAAALAVSRAAFLLVAPSGGGKSTATWALLHHDFGYLSDELSPVELARMEVHAYPRALCLKREPPAAYPLPPDTVRSPGTIHIPIPPLNVDHAPAVLKCIFFLDVCSEAKCPVVRQLSRAEAAARLYIQALNPLAHVEDGLAGAAAIAQRAPCIQIQSGDLRSTCEVVKAKLGELLGAASFSAAASRLPIPC